jgi:NDP-mannose synthase
VSQERAVILAGGKGSRLAPYTAVLPKPLMPLGDRPILDVVLRQLAHHGFGHTTIAVGYLAHLIQAVLGDGEAQGVSIDYHLETEPLGTAGPLATVEGLRDGGSFLVMNGDVLTSLDYRAFFAAHRASGNSMSIATHRRVVQANYGVLHVGEDGGDVLPVTGYEEKPEIPYIVSMGVYALEPSALELIKSGHYDIPDLVLDLLADGQGVGAFPFDGYWLDIGRHDDYEQALADFEDILPRLLP